MEILLYQVDAFTSDLFGGNPAAVCPLNEWLPDETLQAIAAENNLSETAYFLGGEGRYHLRWFTPTTEVDLCGHATLASAHVVLNLLETSRNSVVFETRSGDLKVQREGEMLAMDLPAKPPSPAEPPEGLLEALGGDPLEVLKADYWLVVYGSEADVRALAPDMVRLRAASETPVIVSAVGDEVDFVSRFFAPGYGIPEDPVTGSAHCTLIPFYGLRLSKPTLHARQVSARGGELFGLPWEDKVRLSGHSVLYLTGRIHL
jgi:PhzF family phenazine biosynthesis protein